eukprot:SAG22_NODE_197_length_15520_cov_116.311264_7_plen_70_part_00
MASILASALIDPIISGFGAELDYTHKLKSKPMTLDRVKDMPGAFAAFGKGFIGRAPNNNVSNSGDSQMT